MAPVTQLASHPWPNGAPTLLLQLGPSPAASVDALAARLGFVPDAWDHGSAGPGRGAAFRLPSGLVVSLEYYDREVDDGDEAPGPDVWVDVGDVAERGVAALVTDVLATFGLAPADAAEVAPPHYQRWAAAVLVARREGQLPPVPDDFA